MSGAIKQRLLQAIDQAIKRCNQLRDAEAPAANRDRASQLAREFEAYRDRLELSDDMPDDSMFRMEMARSLSFQQGPTDEDAIAALIVSRNLRSLPEIETFRGLVAQIVSEL